MPDPANTASDVPYLPLEIIERILCFSDGDTLYKAKFVHPSWNNIVDYLTQKTQIWKRCCHQDIPTNELAHYLEKYNSPKSDDMWIDIYNNWYKWKDIKNNVRFDIIHCPLEIPRITYVAVSGDYIIVGSEDGRVKVFEENWGLLCVSRFVAVKVTDIAFMSDDDTKPSQNVLLAYKSGLLLVAELNGRLNELAVIHDVQRHSCYKQFLCYEKRGGRITISKLCRDTNGEQSFYEVTYLRIYSPSEVSCLRMWKGVATFLIHNEVKVLKYDHNIPPVSNVQKKVSIKFCLRNDLSYHIYRNDIIVCTSTCDKLNEQFLELFLLGEDENYSKKIFNSSEIFNATITCMFLYGNIFVIGVDSGNVYFYYVPLWKKFDLHNYQKMLIIGRHPIIGIDVQENKKERNFYITSSFNIHKVVGFIL